MERRGSPPLLLLLACLAAAAGVAAALGAAPVDREERLIGWKEGKAPRDAGDAPTLDPDTRAAAQGTAPATRTRGPKVGVGWSA